MATKYVSGRVKELKVGITNYSESKESLSVIGIVSATKYYGDGSNLTGTQTPGINTTGTSDFNNINAIGIITASSFDGAISEWILGANGSSDYTFTGPGLTGAENDPTIYLKRGQKYNFKNSMGAHPFQIRTAINGSAYNDGVTNNGVSNGTLIWDVQFDAPDILYYQCTAHAGMVGKIYIGNSGDSATIGNLDVGGRIVGSATSNVIPFLYSNLSDLPSAATYHGAFAHVHATQKAYYAHAGNWIELVNKETSGTVGTGTERYNIGPVNLTTLNVSGISTYESPLDIESSVLITGITTIGGLVDINAGGQANTFKVEDLTDNRVVIAGTGGELEDDSNLTFNGTQFNVGSGVTIYQATGIVSATKFHGDGSSLTGIDASALKFGGVVKAQANASGVVVTGVLTATTFKGPLEGNVTGNINGDLTGTLQTAAQPNVTSLGTIASLIASSAKVSDLTNTRVVYAGASGELQDSANLTFNGTTLTGTFAGNGAALTNVPTGINTGGTSDFTTLKVSTLLDVDGHTELDNVNISGVATGTFVGNGAGLTNVPTGINTGGTSDFVNLNLGGTLSVGGTSIFNSPIVGVATFSGATTFSGAIDANGGADISGGTGLTASTAKISDLTNNRVVIVGTSGELEDTTKLTFDGSTLAIVGDATFTGNVSVAGTLTSEDKTNIDSIGIVTARTGVRVTSGGIIVSSGTATFNDSVVASSAKVSDLTSGRVVVAGTAGELEDASTFTFSGGTVTANAFSGDGSALTGITAAGTGAIGGITVKDEGVTVGTAGSISSFDFRGSNVTCIANTGAAGLATITVSDTPSFTNLKVTGISTFTGIYVQDDSGNNDVIIDNNFNASHVYLTLKDNCKAQFGNGTDLQIYHNGSDSYVIDQGTGNVIIGANDAVRITDGAGTENKIVATTNGSVDLYYDNVKKIETTTTGITVTGTCQATDFNSTSDIRLKDNIQVIEDPLSKLVQIEGVSFNWKENNKPALGVIADQVQEILPELVTDGNPKTVNYNGLIGLLIEAVKEQQIQINELKSKLP